MFSLHNPPKWKKPWADIYESQLEQAKLAEDLGYDTVWLTEHHFAEDGYSPSLMTSRAPLQPGLAGFASGQSSCWCCCTIPFASQRTLPPSTSYPGGRFDLGIGEGYARHEFLGYGISSKERASRFEERIDVMRGMWTQDPFSFQGKHYSLQEIRLTPKPVQQPHPPLWVGALNPKAVDRAARLGCHFLGDHTTMRIRERSDYADDHFSHIIADYEEHPEPPCRRTENPLASDLLRPCRFPHIVMRPCNFGVGLRSAWRAGAYGSRATVCRIGP
jgi:Luciferase-like monooxygenase